MSYINSKLKTWLRRNNFKNFIGNPMRETSGYVVRSNRWFLIDIHENEVDVGYPDLDQKRTHWWHWTTEKTISIEEFMIEFARPRKKK